MIVANTDYVQATIELFGFLITLVVTVIFIIITGNKKKSEKSLCNVLIFTGLALLFDAGWYIFDGRTTSAAYFINALSNLAIFLCNPIAVACVNRYTCLVIEENKGKVNKLFPGCFYGIATLVFFIPISNIFYKWMYDIDSNNIYYRLNGWYLYTALNALGVLVCFITVLQYRKNISKQKRISLYVFLMAPFVGIALQTTSIGISFIQMGSALGSFGLLVGYLAEWIFREKDEGDVTEDKKRLWITECCFMLMILFVSASIVSCVVSLDKVSNKNSEQSSKALSYMVSETVNGALSEPISVSRTMAQSLEVINALSEDSIEGTKSEADMIAFMKRLKEEYGYQMIFVASEKNKAYYTYDGLSRYMLVDDDPNDFWYNEFRARNIPYELNIDTDKDNDMSLAVFVNVEVRDKNNNLLGVCGVGKSIESLIEILSLYEDTYSLDVSLTDENGIVQIDTDRDLIGKECLYNKSIFTDRDSDRIYYDKNKNQAIMTKYMKGLDWYMIVGDNNPNKLNLFEIIFPSLVIYVLGIVLMISVAIAFGINEGKRNRQIMRSRLLSEIDRLTGVKNRNAFESFKRSLDMGLIKSAYVYVVMMDINGLKTVNDKLGHIAGDELIMGSTKCIQETLGLVGEIYRIGGDEFVAVSYEKAEIVKEKLDELVEKVSCWKGDLVNELAISVGTACSDEETGKNFNELLQLADERMYADKNAYYRRTGKDRRMTW